MDKRSAKIGALRITNKVSEDYVSSGDLYSYYSDADVERIAKQISLLKRRVNMRVRKLVKGYWHRGPHINETATPAVAKIDRNSGKTHSSNRDD